MNTGQMEDVGLTTSVVLIWIKGLMVGAFIAVVVVDTNTAHSVNTHCKHLSAGKSVNMTL